MARLNFTEQMLKVREDAIIDVVTQLLANKGFDLMSVDEVSVKSGVPKYAIYRHFPSKEELAAEALIRLLDRAMAVLAALQAQEALTALDRIDALIRWALRMQLSGEMPALPTHDAGLRRAVSHHPRFLARLVRFSEQLGGLIEEGQQQGQLSAEMPADLLLQVFFTRAGDPVAQMLKAGGRYSDEQIIELCVSVCFLGVCSR